MTSRSRYSDLAIDGVGALGPVLGAEPAVRATASRPPRGSSRAASAGRATPTGAGPTSGHPPAGRRRPPVPRPEAVLVERLADLVGGGGQQPGGRPVRRPVTLRPGSPDRAVALVRRLDPDAVDVQPGGLASPGRSGQVDPVPASRRRRRASAGGRGAPRSAAGPRPRSVSAAGRSWAGPAPSEIQVAIHPRLIPEDRRRSKGAPRRGRAGRERAAHLEQRPGLVLPAIGLLRPHPLEGDELPDDDPDEQQDDEVRPARRARSTTSVYLGLDEQEVVQDERGERP